MAVVSAAKAVHQPDQEHARPNKENFHGDEEKKEQVGYSKQC